MKTARAMPYQRALPGLFLSSSRILLHHNHGNSDITRVFGDFPTLVIFPLWRFRTLVTFRSLRISFVRSGRLPVYRTVKFVGWASANSDLDMVNPSVAFFFAQIVPFHEALVIT